MPKTLKKSKQFIALCKTFEVDPESIPEVISVEQAFALCGLDPLMIPEVSMLPERHQKAIVATYKMYVVCEALNADPITGKPWTPNWNNSDERKYFPVFDLENSGGSGFSFIFFDYDGWFSAVGSRLSFRTRDLARYAGKQFSNLYKEMFLLP